MHKVRIILIQILVLFFCPCIPAQDLEDVLSSAVRAVGSPDEIAKIRSLEAFADCVGPNGAYTTNIVSRRDGKTRFTQKFSYKNEQNDIIINGLTVWQNVDQRPVSPIQKLIVNLHEYQKMSFDFGRMFHDFALDGYELFGNRPSVKVRAKNELNDPIYLYFDRDLKLLSGYVLPISGTAEVVKNVFNEWKKVGKLILPSKVSATDSSGNWVLTFRKITINNSAQKMFDIPPRIKDLEKLKELHAQQRTAHLTYNAELFVEMFAESVTQIQRGTVIVGTKQENLARFRNYFKTFKFTKWEDVKPPRFKISKDGTLATVIVEKKVSGSYKNEKNEDVFSQTDFAWLEVWEKIGNEWKIITVASTEKVVENNK